MPKMDDAKNVYENSTTGEQIDIQSNTDQFDMDPSDIRTRLEKLVRTYDLRTMKRFIVAESLGEHLIYGSYKLENRNKWEQFLSRKRACRLDLMKNDKIKERYLEYVVNLSTEEQCDQFSNAVISQLVKFGASSPFHYIDTVHIEESNRSLCGHLCKMFDRKLKSWFNGLEAVIVKLTGHISVSGMVRVINGQVDTLFKSGGFLHAINFRVTSMDTPQAADIAEMALAKMLLIQNGLADATGVKLGLLILHAHPERPILRMWEYNPTDDVDEAIKAGDVDALIESGALSEYHEFWKANAHLVDDQEMVAGGEVQI